MEPSETLVIPREEFWAKTVRNEAGSITAWHALRDHSADVAACAEALLAQPTWRRRLSAIAGAGNLSAITCSRLAVFAALHDLGKFNIGFQAKVRIDLGTLPAGHVKEGRAALEALPLTELARCDWGEASLGLLASAICHHGRPYAFEEVVCDRKLWAPTSGLDPRRGLQDLVDSCERWFPNAFRAHDEELPPQPEFEHAFAGLVMLADWIASDTRFFPLANGAAPDRMLFARAAARDFMRESWLDIDAVRRSQRSHVPAFSRVSEHPPRAAQRMLIEHATEGSHPSPITIMEAETGSGKTEAALAHFVTLFAEGYVDGMYFALPTRTAATQMYQRIRDCVARAFDDAPPVVLAVPGYLGVDGMAGTRLPDFDVLWHDSPTDLKRQRTWAAEGAKRYLSGCIVVGTIDQVLLSTLRVMHAHLRAIPLLRLLLVVDEVHASDSYMSQLLSDVLSRHVAAGGHALLLSATLGAETRAQLLAPSEPVRPPDLLTACATPYPLASSRVRYSEAAGELSTGSRRVAVDRESWMDAPETIADFACGLAQQGAKVLVIRNTVDDCLILQQSVLAVASDRGRPDILFRCNGVPVPHHSRYSRPDREALDAAIERNFGKQRTDGGCVAVATQTVQQSLDLDADFMITDLAPMDVLLQRVGRLHRHVRERPLGFEIPRVVVLVPRDRDLANLITASGKGRHHHGLGSVYADLRILHATWLQLEQCPEWDIPAMCRHLVESSVHSEALAKALNPNDDRWRQHAAHVLGNLTGQTRQAQLNTVVWTKPYSDSSFQEDERIPTRLGASDRRVTFPSRPASALGLQFSELSVPARWVRDLPLDTELAEGLARTEAGWEFRFGSRIFTYDALGLRRKASASGDDDDGS